MHYSFDADLRSVLRRLAASENAGAAPENEPGKPAAEAKPAAPRPTGPQPRLEIAHVALRQQRHEIHNAVT